MFYFPVLIVCVCVDWFWLARHNPARGARSAPATGMAKRISAVDQSDDAALQQLAAAFDPIWQCYQADYKCWFDYKPDINGRIEVAWMAQEAWVPAGDPDDPQKYRIDFVRMMQVNMDTETARPVRRVLVTHT